MQHISLDGVMQHSADGGDFPYTGWTAPYRTPAGAALVLAAYGESFDLLLGRRTYDQWSELWPTAPSSPMSDGLNRARKFVLTHRPDSLEWGPFEGLSADVPASVRRIKSEDGPDLVVAGSSSLISTLLEQGLADELLLISYPVLLGTGKRFFADGTPAQAYRFDSTQTSPTGVVLTTYTSRRPAQPLLAMSGQAVSKQPSNSESGLSAELPSGRVSSVGPTTLMGGSAT